VLETETCPTPPAGSARSSARNSQGTGYRRLAEAEPLVRRALEVDEKSCGAEHPNVARDLNSLALLLKTTNRLAGAEPLMRCDSPQQPCNFDVRNQPACRVRAPDAARCGDTIDV